MQLRLTDEEVDLRSWTTLTYDIVHEGDIWKEQNQMNTKSITVIGTA